MKKMNWLTIVLYVLAGITGVYALYALIGAIQYVSDYVAQGYISYSSGFGEIIGYYITTAGPHIFYAVAFGVMGYVVKCLQGCHGAVVQKEAEIEEKVEVSKAFVADEQEAPKQLLRYCKKCYTVVRGETLPECCPECGEPLF